MIIDMQMMLDYIIKWNHMKPGALFNNFNQTIEEVIMAKHSKNRFF